MLPVIANARQLLKRCDSSICTDISDFSELYKFVSSTIFAAYKSLQRFCSRYYNGPIICFGGEFVSPISDVKACFTSARFLHILVSISLQSFTVREISFKSSSLLQKSRSLISSGSCRLLSTPIFDNHKKCSSDYRTHIVQIDQCDLLLNLFKNWNSYLTMFYQVVLVNSIAYISESLRKFLDRWEILLSDHPSAPRLCSLAKISWWNYLAWHAGTFSYRYNPKTILM